MTAVRHVIMDEPLRCFGQMLTGRQLAGENGAVLHLTARCIGQSRAKHPGMGSDCMPVSPSHGAATCRHDLAALRAEGAVDITAAAPCWTPDGNRCPACTGASAALPVRRGGTPTGKRGKNRMRSPAPTAQGALW